MSTGSVSRTANHSQKPIEKNPKVKTSTDKKTSDVVRRYDLSRMNPSMDPGLINPSVLQDKNLQKKVPESAFKKVDTGLKTLKDLLKAQNKKLTRAIAKGESEKAKSFFKEDFDANSLPIKDCILLINMSDLQQVRDLCKRMDKRVLSIHEQIMILANIDYLDCNAKTYLDLVTALEKKWEVLTLLFNNGLGKRLDMTQEQIWDFFCTEKCAGRWLMFLGMPAKEISKSLNDGIFTSAKWYENQWSQGIEVIQKWVPFHVTNRDPIRDKKLRDQCLRDKKLLKDLITRDEKGRYGLSCKEFDAKLLSRGGQIEALKRCSAFLGNKHLVTQLCSELGKKPLSFTEKVKIIKLAVGYSNFTDAAHTEIMNLLFSNVSGVDIDLELVSSSLFHHDSLRELRPVDKKKFYSQDMGKILLLPEFIFFELRLIKSIQNGDLRTLEEMSKLFDLNSMIHAYSRLEHFYNKMTRAHYIAFAKGDFDTIRFVLNNCDVKDRFRNNEEVENIIDILKKIEEGNWELVKLSLLESKYMSERLIYYIVKCSSLESPEKKYDFLQKIIKTISADGLSQNKDPIKRVIETIFLIQPKADPDNIALIQPDLNKIVNVCFVNARQRLLDLITQATGTVIPEPPTGIIGDYLGHFTKHNNLKPTILRYREDIKNRVLNLIAQRAQDGKTTIPKFLVRIVDGYLDYLGEAHDNDKIESKPLTNQTIGLDDPIQYERVPQEGDNRVLSPEVQRAGPLVAPQDYALNGIDPRLPILPPLDQEFGLDSEENDSEIDEQDPAPRLSSGQVADMYEAKLGKQKEG